MTRTTTSPPPLGVAIVGCGLIGVNHARAVARHPGLIIVALVDSQPAAADALACLVHDELALVRPAVFATLGAALAAAPVDLVVICTPSGLHADAATEALAAGKHVLVEKPLDAGLAPARRLVLAAERAAAAGQVVSVISQHRFDPASLAVAMACHSGALGRLTSGLASVAWWRGQDYYDSGQWRGTWALDGGGAVMNQGVHTVDLLVWFLGRPVTVSAQTACLAHHGVEVEDIAVATIGFGSGALAVLHATTAAYPGLTARLQIHGSRGSAIIDGDQLDYFHAAPDGNALAGAFGAAGSATNQAADLVPAAELTGGDRGPAAFVDGHLRQYDDIVDAVRTGRPPSVSLADALLALAVVRSVYLSATLGRTVAVDEVLEGAFDDVAVATGGQS